MIPFLNWCGQRCSEYMDDVLCNERYPFLLMSIYNIFCSELFLLSKLCRVSLEPYIASWIFFKLIEPFDRAFCHYTDTWASLLWRFLWNFATVCSLKACTSHHLLLNQEGSNSIDLASVSKSTVKWLKELEDSKSSLRFRITRFII